MAARNTEVIVPIRRMERVAFLKGLHVGDVLELELLADHSELIVAVTCLAKLEPSIGRRRSTGTTSRSVVMA
jgi:hypothetical protein